jgi:hypothetical protein
MNGLVLSVATVVLGVVSIELVLRWLDVADPPVFQYNPHYGYLMRPDQSVSTRGLRFRINNAGFRGADISPQKLGERRAVFVGDSVCYGGGTIPDADLFVNRVSEALSALRQERVTAINVSAPAWGIENMAAFIAANGVFEADVVVWVVPSGDFRRAKMRLQFAGYPQTRPRCRLIFVAATWLFAFRHRQWHARAASEPSVDAGAHVLEANLAALDTTLRGLRAAGIPFVMAVLPGESGYGNLANDLRPLKATAGAHGAAFVDLEPALRMARDTPLFFDGAHLTRRGHAIVADALLSAVSAALASQADARAMQPRTVMVAPPCRGR